MSVLSNVLEAVGSTPLVRLQRLSKRKDVEILLKLDFLNPGGSTKDRPLVRMLEEAEINGDLKPGDKIIDSSSGNFAVAMAMAGAVRNYPVVCVVDPKLTKVVEQMLVALGAELVFATEADDTGSYLRSRLALRDALVASTPNAWCPNQYRNRASLRAHYYGTGAEIYDAVEGMLDVLVVATGTGGTISGASWYLKKRLPNTHVVAADAFGSKIFDEEIYPWLQKGLGSGLRAEELEILDVDVIDEVRLIGDEEAFLTARALARNEGIMAGGSAGCALFAALTLSRELPAGSRIVTILPDRLERYLFEHNNDEWMVDNGFETSKSCEDVWAAVGDWCSNAELVFGPAGLPVRKRSSRTERESLAAEPHHEQPGYQN